MRCRHLIKIDGRSRKCYREVEHGNGYCWQHKRTSKITRDSDGPKVQNGGKIGNYGKGQNGGGGKGLIQQRGGNIGINIRVITWNVGDAIKQPASFPGVWGDLLSGGHHIIVFGIQEDKTDSGFMPALNSYMEEMGYMPICYGSSAPTAFSSEMRYIGGKHIRMCVFIHTSIMPNVQLYGKKTVRHKTKFGISAKGTFGLGFDVGNMRLVFANSHLPVKPKRDQSLTGYGHQKRIESYQNAEVNVIRPLIGHSSNYTVFWMGDMNFRCVAPFTQQMIPKQGLIRRPSSWLGESSLRGSLRNIRESWQDRFHMPQGVVEPIGGLGGHDFQCQPGYRDQLKTAMKTRFDIFTGYAEGLGNRGPEFPPTCRMNEKECDAVCQSARMQSSDIIAPPAYDPTRDPSYCDRILYKSFPGQSFQINAYKSYVNPMVAYSDHNVVYADFTVLV